VWHHHNTKVELGKLLTECRQDGYPILSAELDERYPSVAPEENAALIYMAAFTNLAGADSSDLHAFETNSIRLGANASFDFLQLKSLLARNCTTLQLLHEASKRKKSRYPLKSTRGLLFSGADLESLRKCVALLSLEALAHSQCGGPTPTDSVEAILALGDSLAKEPITRSQFYRMNFNRRAVVTLEIMLNRGAMPEAELNRLSDAFRNSEQTSDLTGAFSGELCRGLVLDVNFVAEILYRDTEGFASGIRKELMKLAVIATDRAYADKTFYVSSLRTYLAAAKNAYPLRLQMIDGLIDRKYRQAKSRLYPVSAYLLPWLGSIVPSDAENIARLRAAQTVLAIERYRHRHDSKLPEKLSDLCPELLGHVPQDPFDGRPLRFKVLPDGFVVYSIGKDLQDNGGQTQKDWQNWNSPFDVTLTIKR
jgi:hypothetical protein